MSANTNQPSRFFRISMYILGIIALLLAGIHLTVQYYLEPLLQKKLSGFIEKGSDGLYHCDIGDVDITLWTGSAAVRDLQITIDSNRFAEMKENGTLPPVMFHVELERGKISGFKLFRFLFAKKLALGDVITKDAVVHIYRNYSKKKEKGEKSEPLWKQMQPHLKGISVNRIVLENVKLTYEPADGSRKFLFSYEQGSAELENIWIDSASAADSTRFLFTRHISADFKNMELFTKDSMYRIEMEELSYSSREQKTDIVNFRLSPVFSSDSMKKYHGHQIDVYSGTVARMEIVNFLPQQLALEGKIFIDTIRTWSPDFDIFHDRNAPIDTAERFKRFPHVALLNAKAKVHIKYTELNDGKVAYREKNQKNQLTGTVKFSEIYGSIHHLGNTQEQPRGKNTSTARFKGKFLDVSPISAVFTLTMEPGAGDYWVSGELGPMNRGTVNQIAVPLGNLKITSGALQSATFSMHGNREGMRGILHMKYKDLGVEMLKKDKNSGEIKEKQFMTFLANSLFLRDDNPVGDPSPYKPNYVELERRPEQSFFNSIWKTILKGIQETIIRGPLRKKQFGKPK